jgi:hypothetical protein
MWTNYSDFFFVVGKHFYCCFTVIFCMHCTSKFYK